MTCPKVATGKVPRVSTSPYPALVTWSRIHPLQGLGSQGLGSQGWLRKLGSVLAQRRNLITGSAKNTVPILQERPDQLNFSRDFLGVFDFHFTKYLSYRLCSDERSQNDFLLLGYRTCIFPPVMRAFRFVLCQWMSK